MFGLMKVMVFIFQDVFPGLYLAGASADSYRAQFS